MAGTASSDKERKQRSMKACDRCRLKKVKCCGSVPCSRCRQDDAICEYGIRRNHDGRNVSAAHVNQLQIHNDLLVKAIKKLWETYAQPVLGEEGKPIPSIHELVQKAGILDEYSARHLQLLDAFPDEVERPSTALSLSPKSVAQPTNASTPIFGASGSHAQHSTQDTTLYGSENNFDAFELDSAFADDCLSPEHSNVRSGSGFSDSSAQSSSATPGEPPNMTEIPPLAVAGIKRVNKPKMRLPMPPSYVAPPSGVPDDHMDFSTHPMQYGAEVDASYQQGAFDHSNAMDDELDSWALSMPLH